MCKERRGVQGWNETRPLPEEPGARSEEQQFRGETGLQATLIQGRGLLPGNRPLTALVYYRPPFQCHFCFSLSSIISIHNGPTGPDSAQ